jgi:NAD+ diphosphatase
VVDFPLSAPVLALSRAAHDRAAQYRSDDSWLAAAWPAAQVVLLSADQRTPLTEHLGQLSLRFALSQDVDQAAPRTFLGIRDDVAFFTVLAAPTDDWQGLREVGTALDDLGAGLLTASTSLSHWHATHQHCPRCGAQTAVVSAGWVRRCPVDGSLHFPRTDPAVIMLVHDGGDRCVLGRQASWAPGRFSILAGFVESGEACEAAVEREVLEEVGLLVTDVQYVASQPWPFPASLMLGFTARVVGDQTIAQQDDELAEAAWFTKDEIRAAVDWGREDDDDSRKLRGLPGELSIARQILNRWLAHDRTP